jgi:hypothetical protein
MKEYMILQEALDKATQRGSFNLQEVGIIMSALKGVHGDLEVLPKIREELDGYRKREGSAKDLQARIPEASNLPEDERTPMDVECAPKTKKNI